MQLKTTNDYRKVTHILDEQEQECYTYKVDEKRTIREVLRGITHFTTLKDIKEELSTKEFEVIYQDLWK